MTRLEQFNKAVVGVTDERASVYGSAEKNFDQIARLKAVVAECKNPLARHALEMICVKVARLIQTPDHLDSWIDIAGYARTGVMVTEPKDEPSRVDSAALQARGGTVATLQGYSR